MAVKREIPQHEPRPEKVQTIETLVETLKEKNGTILTDYRGMTVKAMSELRAALRAKGASYQVIKNTMLTRAAAEVGYESIQPWLEGPTAAVLLESDIVGPTKALLDFARVNANRPAIKGAFVEGRKLDLPSIKALAELPSREILLATLVGCLQAPMCGLLGTLQAAMGNLVGTLNSLEAAKAG